ncbi:phosphotransferase [Clostridiaceae bacterium M8S5]|nr:phosphotransferase [Clostridiaceae bacterium M8S5]
MGGFENMVYEYHVGNNQYILRITHDSHRNKSLLKGEIDWLEYLSENGASVARPVLIGNDYIGEVTKDNSYFFVTLFQKVNGHSVQEIDWTNKLIKGLGKVIGKIHNLSKRYKPSSNSIKRPEWDNEDFLNIDKKEPGLCNVYGKFEDTVRYISSFEKRENTYGLIHGDIHFGNLKIDSNKIVLFDFDSCLYSWYINDIAILLFFSWCNYGYQMKEKSFVNNFLNHFLNGYEQFNHLDRKDFDEYLPTFLKLREIDLYTELNKLPLSEYYAYEKYFMKNRKEKIENEIPFINIDSVSK